MFLKLTKEWNKQPAGATVDVPEEYAQALIDSKTAEPVTGDPLAETISKSLEGATKKWADSMDSVINLTLQKFQDAQSQAKKHAIPAIFGKTGEGDPKKTFGNWLLGVKRGDRAFLEKEFGSTFNDWEAKAAMNEAGGTTGGYTVPSQFVAQLFQLASENAVVRPRATVIPMATKTAQIPALDVVTAPSSGDTAYFGGLKATWSAEAAALTEAEPAFKQIDLTAHELSGYSKVSNALLADNAIGLESLLLNLFGRAIGWYEDYAFLRGNGAGKPQGVLNAGSLISVTRSANSAFALSDAAGMLARLLPGYDPNHCVWAIHPTVLPKLIQMTSAGGYVVFIDTARDTPRMVLFGIPVQVSEKLPSLNTLGDVLLMDLRQYVIGDRQSIDIAFSEHVAFLNNQGTWRFVERVDGQPWMRSAVTLSDAASTLSAFVGLAAG
jgi:HK97 family phage major capsid protein